MYTVEWREKMVTSDKFMFFSSFKQSLTLSHYLLHVKHPRARSDLARFRFGMLPLRARSLQFNGNDLNEHAFCPFCDQAVENELHVIFVCPMYSHLRDKYIPYKYARKPVLHTLSILMAKTNPTLCTNVALFVHHALMLRSNFLPQPT